MYRVYFYDPSLGYFDSLTYKATSEQDALDQFHAEVKLPHRSVKKEK